MSSPATLGLARAPLGGRVEIYERWIENEGLALFSSLCRKDLLKLVGSHARVELIEAACTIGNYHDRDDMRAFARATGQLLRKRGVRMPRGKRACPGLVKMVADVSGLLVGFGMPLRTGGAAKMVLILSRIAAELDMPDPRHQLRCIARKEADQRRRAEASVRSVLLTGLKG